MKISSQNSQRSQKSNKSYKPSELNKTMLLIFMSAPVIATMYSQDVNIWVIVIISAIVISQAFNLSSLRMQASTLDIVLDRNIENIQTANKIIDKLATNQVILKEKNDTLIAATEIMLKDISRLKIIIDTNNLHKTGNNHDKE